MKIQIAGPGCPRCRTTERNVNLACRELELDAEISEISEFEETEKLGTAQTPAVLSDGEIVIGGRIPTISELKALLRERG